MSNTNRTFIAVDTSAEIRKTLQQVQDHLKACDCNIKWVKPKNIHLTLKFLGDVNPKIIIDVQNVLNEIASKSEHFVTELTQLGAFPSIHRPRILWAGLKDDNKNIVRLVTLLESKLGTIGFKKESKPFSPHITIGRIRSPRNLKTLTQELADYSIPIDILQSIQKITLYKSTLTSSEPIYEVLKEFNFINN